MKPHFVQFLRVLRLVICGLKIDLIDLGASSCQVSFFAKPHILLSCLIFFFFGTSQQLCMKLYGFLVVLFYFHISAVSFSVLLFLARIKVNIRLIQRLVSLINGAELNLRVFRELQGDTKEQKLKSKLF